MSNAIEVMSERGRATGSPVQISDFLEMTFL